MVEDEAGIGDANPHANVLAPEPVDGLSNQVVLLVVVYFLKNVHFPFASR